MLLSKVLSIIKPSGNAHSFLEYPDSVDLSIIYFIENNESVSGVFPA